MASMREWKSIGNIMAYLRMLLETSLPDSNFSYMISNIGSRI
jgi:hypothetical protein